MKSLWGIWCKDKGKKGGWMREDSRNYDQAILAFTNKEAARARAAEEYGFHTYREAKAKCWVEVRPLIAD